MSANGNFAVRRERCTPIEQLIRPYVSLGVVTLWIVSALELLILASLLWAFLRPMVAVRLWIIGGWVMAVGNVFPLNDRTLCIAEVQASEVGGSDQTVCDTKGTEDTYPIVGIDEANVQERRTIWISPLARAPEKTRKGDTVHFDSPGGLRELDIVQFRYE